MTNRQQLERLKEPYRSQAFENCKNNSLLYNTDDELFLNEESKALSITLSLAFSWGRSPQKGDYWAKIHNNPENYTEQ